MQITPQNSLFTLAHIGIPQVDKMARRLDIGGMVERPHRFTYDELRRLPKHNIESFHNQCAGFPRRPDVATRRVVMSSGQAQLSVMSSPVPE